MKKNGFFVVLLAILCGVFLFNGWQLWQIQREYREAEEVYQDLTQYIELPEIPVRNTEREETGNDQQEEDDTVWPAVDFEALRQINPDVVGWIYIEGTSVNYPIVQGDDNNYYLKRMLDGTWNSNGSIFLDCDSEPDFTGKNSIIYGHNMRNGAMFQTILSYKKQEFFEEHPVALLLTPQGNYRIRFFSGYTADVSDSAWELYFADTDYEKWLSEIGGRSCFVSDVVPDREDRVVTLSTCSYEFDNARFVLHGILEQ